jgi:Fic family protein
MVNIMAFIVTNPHKLKKLPPTFEIYEPKLVDALIRARTAIAELKGYTVRLPNAHLLISPTLTKESVASSNIENINTTISEVFQGELIPETEQKQPEKEVLRYRQAIEVGNKYLEKYSISSRLILKVHDTLLKTEDEGYRQVQNKIENTLTHEVLYTPPIASDIPGLISNLERFANNQGDNLDPLLRAAIMHYQFEAIHPFNDGNGRTGRILMVLYLVKSNLLSLPTLYISGYINEHKNDYYKYLNNVTRNNDWNKYLLFMLNGLYEQACKTKQSLVTMMDALEKFKSELKNTDKTIYSADLAEVLFSYPYINPTKLANQLGIHRVTASRYLKKIAAKDMLMNINVGKYSFYVNNTLLDIVNNL